MRILFGILNFLLAVSYCNKRKMSVVMVMMMRIMKGTVIDFNGVGMGMRRGMGGDLAIMQILLYLRIIMGYFGILTLNLMQTI